MSYSTNEAGPSTIRPSPTSFKANNEKQKVPAVAFLSGDKYIITCSRDDCLQVTDAKTGKLVGDPWQDRESSQICAIAVSPNGKFVATGSKDGRIRLWTWNGKTTKIVARSKRHTAAANCLRWSPHDNGVYIASGFDDGRVAVWQVVGRPSASELKNPISIDKARLEHIYAIDYSHDGKQIIVSGYDCEFSVLRINEGVRKLELDKVVGVCSNPDQVPCATWVQTADGHAIVTGSTDGKLRMRYPENRTYYLDVNAHSDRICAVVPSPDKRILASASYDRTLRVLDLKAKPLIGPPLKHSAEVTCAAFAASGTLLAAGTSDGMIYVWDISGLPMEDVTNVHDTDADNKGAKDAMTPLPGVNAKSLFDVDSAIPTRRHEPARRDSPRYNDNFWGAPDVTRPKPRDNIVVSDTPRASPGTGTRFSIPQYVKRVQVAAARMRMPLTVTRLRSTAAASVDVPPSPKTATDRLFFHTQRQQSTPRDPAIDQQPRRTLTAESRTLSIHVRPTRLVKTLLYMGCIPETGD